MPFELLRTKGENATYCGVGGYGSGDSIRSRSWSEIYRISIFKIHNISNIYI